MVRIYDTPLSPEQMLAYNQFLKESQRGMDETDYDLRGFFKDGNSFDAAGHGADWYKKPNHPTFSNESQYHGTPAPSAMGKPIRQAGPSEMDFFQRQPHIGGYAAEDGMVVLNPFTSLSPSELGAVAKNEAVRQWLRNMDTPPDVRLTGAQQQTFAGYSENPRDIQDTILARIISGDPSAGQATAEQMSAAQGIMDHISQNMRQPINMGGQWSGDEFIPSQHNLNVHGTRGIAQELLRSGQGVSLGGPGLLEALIREMGL